MATVENSAFNVTPLTASEQAITNQPGGVDATALSVGADPAGAAALQEGSADPYELAVGADVAGAGALQNGTADPYSLAVGADPSGAAGLLAGASPAVTVLKPTQQYQQTFDNPLFNYENYTYNLSWHILTQREYNNLSNNPGTAYIPMNCLVASGGKNSATFRRNPYFIEDFYFDDFKVTTVVNTTTYSKNSNAIEFAFTIVEPNGFTLINRLLDAVSSVGGQNYLQQPYLLMIEFTGYRDGVLVSIPNQTKYLPIKLISMKSSVTTRGTEYRIEASPFNHSAYDETIVKTPALVKVEAKTVQDLLGSLDAADPLTVASINAARNERENNTAVVQSLLNDPDPEVRRQAAEELSVISRSSIEYQSKGLCDGINSYYQNIRQNTGAIRYPNVYRVVFDKEIGNSKLIVSADKGLNNVSNAASPDTAKNNARAAAGAAVGQIDFTSGVYNIKPGVSIMSVIEYAVRNSDYLTRQLVDPTANNAGISQLRLRDGNNLRWFKVIPKVVLGAYDPVTKTTQKFITYYVKPWTVSPKNPYAPLGKAAGYTKKYDYIFTGKNRDVLDCKIDFDMLYYLQLTADANKVRQTETGPAASAPDSAAAGSNAGITVPNDPLQPVPTTYISSNQNTSVRSGPDQAKAYRAADTSRDITMNSRGDMINVKLRIIGDPHFIKQDDLFYNQSLTPTTSMFVSNNNQSLVFDDGELYVFLNFQSPADYNDATGLAIPGVSPYQYSLFSGTYKIVTVANEFRGGKFEQVLDLVRLPINDTIKNAALNIQSRFDSIVNQGLGQLVAFGATRFSGPLILQNQLGAGTGLVSAAASASGGGTLGSLVQGLVSQVSGQLIDKAIGKIAEIFKTPTFSTNPADYKVFEPTATQYGAFGEAPTGAVTDAAASTVDTTSSTFVEIGPDGVPIVNLNVQDIGLANDLNTASDLAQTVDIGLANDLGSASDLAQAYESLSDAGFIDYGAFI